MLEQAIVDATALKEAAMKNAEAAILEKYSKEIKETVDSMLNESPEEEAEYAAMEPPAQEEPAAPEAEDAGSTTLVLNLTELEDLARQSAGEDLDMAEIMAHEDPAADVEAAETAPEPTGDVGNIDEEIDLTNLFEGEEEIEITQEEIKDIEGTLRR